MYTNLLDKLENQKKEFNEHINTLEERSKKAQNESEKLKIFIQKEKDKLLLAKKQLNELNKSIKLKEKDFFKTLDIKDKKLEEAAKKEKELINTSDKYRVVTDYFYRNGGLPSDSTISALIKELDIDKRNFL